MADVNSLKEDVDSLRGELKSLSDAVKHQAESRARSSYERARAVGGKAREEAQKGTAFVEDEIEERPLISVLTAFGVGFVLGKLLDRK